MLLISIHAPRGGSDATGIRGVKSINDFNPRSPWGERPGRSLASWHILRFQSTLPVGGATVSKANSEAAAWISIHAPRGGSDFTAVCTGYDGRKFQSTLPVGGATVFGIWLVKVVIISIHAPRGGSDQGEGHHRS